jgi:PAS domain S-box-containing protein
MKAIRGKEVGPRAGLGFVLASVLLAVFIAGGGYFYYSRYAANYRTEMGSQLSAIGQLKAEQLATWRAERLGDASSLLMNGAFAVLVERFLNGSGDSPAESELRSWLATYQVNAQYDEVRLLDAEGVTRLAVPSPTPPLPLAVSEQLPEALQSGRARLVDFYRTDSDQAIRLTVLVPIRGRDRATVVGIVTLCVDPAVYLYPFISRWPTASMTAETLLVRRDGSDALFLNELKYQKDTALTLRVPLASHDVPAAKAALGEAGVVEGVDYRGVRVLADVRAVPDSPWFLVARMDLAEIYAPLRQRLWQIVLLVAVALLGTGAGLAALWRHREAGLYRERAEAAERLRSLSARHEAILDSVPDIIMEVDNDRIYIWMNQPGRDFFGEDAIGKQASDYFVGEQDTYRAVEPLFVGEENLVYVESWQRRRDGEERLLAWWCRQLRDSSGNVSGALSSARDITDLRRAEEAKERLTLDLKRSNKELEQFAYVASHDLQEPLRMVSSYVQLLAQRYEGGLDEKAHKYIDYAVDGAARMQQLIEDLLLYSRAGTHGGPLAPTDSGAALATAVENLAKRIEQEKAIVTHGDLPIVRADASQLVQVFQNLVSNAVKFHGEAPPRIHVSAEERAREWVLSVRDNGIGIDPKYGDRVFAIFQRLHTREEYPGTGIGLAVCQRIVERHGGWIGFESEPGKGSTFHFGIPK